MRIILPDTEPEEKPTWIDIWHDRKYGYCAQLKAEEGNPIGNVEYSGTKEGIVITEKQWEDQHNIIHEYSVKKRKTYKQYLKNL